MPRLPFSYGNQGWPSRSRTSSCQGTQEAHCLVSVNTIKSKKEFGQVFSDGRRDGGRLVRVVFLESEQDGSIAFVAAKRLGNAVYRNRCKRLLREAARKLHLPVEGTAMILFSTCRTHDAKPSEISRELSAILSRNKLFQES